MKRLWFIGLAAVIMVAVLGTSVMAAGSQSGRPHGPRKGGFMAELNLTPEQEQKLLEIRQKHAREVLPLRQELQKKHLELRQLWHVEKPNASTIEEKMKEMVPLQVKLRMKALEMRNEMKALLTPEQLKKFEEFRPGRSFGRRGWGHHGNGPKGPNACKF